MDWWIFKDLLHSIVGDFLDDLMGDGVHELALLHTGILLTVLMQLCVELSQQVLASQEVVEVFLQHLHQVDEECRRNGKIVKS